MRPADFQAALAKLVLGALSLASSSVQLPFVDRIHQTIAECDTAISSSQSSGIGNMRVLVRYQEFSPQHSRLLRILRIMVLSF